MQAVKSKRRTHDVGPVAPCDNSSHMQIDVTVDTDSAQEGRGQTADHSYCNSTVYAESSVPCSNEACRETETFKDNDDVVQVLTGLPSFAKMMVVFTFVFLKARGPRDQEPLDVLWEMQVLEVEQLDWIQEQCECHFQVVLQD
ncbi:hypothetical protein FQN60_009106, partial [Etheostoma spectabile]